MAGSLSEGGFGRCWGSSSLRVAVRGLAEAGRRLEGTVCGDIWEQVASAGALTERMLGPSDEGEQEVRGGAEHRSCGDCGHCKGFSTGLPSGPPSPVLSPTRPVLPETGALLLFS